MYKTVSEPIREHTAVRYCSWLLCTVMILRVQQTATHFNALPSQIHRPFRGQVRIVSYGCCVRVFI